MCGILLLAHGSRAKETEQSLESVADMVRNMLPDKTIQTAFMEFGNVNIEAGLDKLVHSGAEEIKVIPYFLFDGIHIQEDIPGEIQKYTQSHPNIKISMGRTLGTDPRLAEILRDRIEECIK